MSKQARKRVVILGGGFAGVYTAQYLEKALGRRDDFEITLINKENYFVFQPMLPEVISGSIGLLDTVSPIRRLLPRTNLHVRDIESIDLANKTITTSPGFRPHPHIISYDYLVFALGNVTDFRGLRGLPEHALPFKNLADALYLRNHVIRALEEAAIETDDMELRRQLLTFVVAGGGFSGVEVTAELNDFVREVARNYRGIDPKELRVVLIHSQERILPEMSEKLALFAQDILKKRGVEIMLNARLEAATGEEAILKDGERIPTRTLVSTVPSSPHPIIDGLALPKGKNGRLIANKHLEVEGAENIWSVGDCAQVPTPKGEGFCPPTAQHAIRQARTAANNILVALRGSGERQSFAFEGLGTMGALGHRSAVAEIFGHEDLRLHRVVDMANDLFDEAAGLGPPVEGGLVVDARPVFACGACRAEADRLDGNHKRAFRAGRSRLSSGRHRRPHLHNHQRQGRSSARSGWNRDTACDGRRRRILRRNGAAEKIITQRDRALHRAYEYNEPAQARIQYAGRIPALRPRKA